MNVTTQVLSYRTIDPELDAGRAVAHHVEACVCSFGDEARFQGSARYLRWLGSKVEEFPEGFLMAMLGEQIVGQLELESPYGLEVGYVNLFYVTPAFRGLGFAQSLHERAERYFRSWEARRIELHCSPTNERAMRFYRKMGYRRSYEQGDGVLWKLEKEI